VSRGMESFGGEFSGIAGTAGRYVSIGACTSQDRTVIRSSRGEFSGIPETFPPELESL